MLGNDSIGKRYGVGDQAAIYGGTPLQIGRSQLSTLAANHALTATTRPASLPAGGQACQQPASQNYMPHYGNPNERNSNGYFIRDERGEIDAPHERENAHCQRPSHNAEIDPRFKTEGRKTPPPTLEQWNLSMNTKEKRLLQNRNAQRVFRYNNKYNSSI